MDSHQSVSTVAGDEAEPPSLDLSSLPPVFVLSTHLDTASISRYEDLLTQCGASLTHDAWEARIFIGKLEQKRRALFELHALGVSTLEVAGSLILDVVVGSRDEPAKKRRRLGGGPRDDAITVEDSSTASEPEAEVTFKTNTGRHDSIPTKESATSVEDAVQTGFHIPDDEVVVLRLSWLEDSKAAARIYPFDKHTVYHGRRNETVSQPPSHPRSSTPPRSSPNAQSHESPDTSILARARAELGPERGQPPSAFTSTTQPRRHWQHSRPHASRAPILRHESTSEHDDPSASHGLPPAPDWVVQHNVYSCCRATPADPPNAAFLAQLHIIRTARKLTSDEIGVRAYSSAMAAVAAYPYAIGSRREILRLPGCEGKIAALWAEWRGLNPGGGAVGSVSGEEPDAQVDVDGAADGGALISAAREALEDPRLQVLRLFYDIWGVGEKTAREFYAAGWRDMDDVVEYGWGSLTRVQQIGVKYYDDFLRKMPRAEVESIAGVVHAAARAAVRDAAGVRSCIVGGYRRGKAASGDVDVIITHLDESETVDLVKEIVRVLVERGWVTHELITTTAGSRRGQATLPFRGGGGGGGAGFDTLDKALVVWQDPQFEGRAGLPASWTEEQVRKRNPNVHRRVDIIIAPWGKVGCAVLGWTAGTTFERDLRRYAKHTRNWKFDSSGVRDRGTGKELDLEGVGGRCETIEEAERKVFEGLGLIYREPWERCAD